MSEQLTSLRLVDYSDRELLQRVHDLSDDDGWVTAQVVADALDMDHEHPSACVGSRFNWLRRYGAMEREKDRWRMTDDGRSLAFGQINTVMSAGLDNLPEDRMLSLVRQVSKRYQHAGGVAAVLMNREWRHGMAQRTTDG